LDVGDFFTMDLSTTTASNIVALMRGLVGIGIALLPVIRDYLASRHARLVVALEKLYRPDTTNLQERIRIENLGPSSARDVKVMGIGLPLVGPHDYRPAFEWNLPVEVLQPGQDYVLLLATSEDDADPTSIILTWADRTGAKQAQFTLSPKYL
jgi:hypothetical protein